MQFSVKNNILHFQTNGHPWNRLASDLHKNMQPTAFSITNENFVEVQEKCQKLSSRDISGPAY